MDESYRIIVVDDHPIWREGVVRTIDAEQDLSVVGEGASTEDALRLVEDLLPDMVLLDVSMPGGGINAAQSISNEYPVVKIAMLTVSEDGDDVRAALNHHAKGYILKGVSGSDLVAIVRKICAGESYVTPSLAASILVESRESTLPGDGNNLNLPELLNQRERQILEKLAEGLSNKEIADSIHLSEKTVKHYMTNIMQKLQARNRLQAALIAHGVKSPGAD